MRVLSSTLLLVGAVASRARGEDEFDSPTDMGTATATATMIPACTATAPGSGAFYDLRPDLAVFAEEGDVTKGVTTDYKAKGWDYGMNFTMNLCGAVVEQVEDVLGVERSLWQNISAYYTTAEGQVVSIGQESMDLVSRGRKLVLTYTGGSPCDSDAGEAVARRRRRDSSRKAARDASTTSYSDYVRSDEDGEPSDTEPLAADDITTLEDDDGEDDDSNEGEGGDGEDDGDGDGDGDGDEDDDGDDEGDSKPDVRRKSTILSFHCDRDPGLQQASVSFVGTPDECAYFFEVRSQNACPRAEPDKPGSVGPGSVFALILLIAILVYVFGGVFYNRTVTHARGWRQLPNYSLWASIWNAITDVFFSLLSCLARFLPSRRGYRHLGHSPGGRGYSREDENRLIDQLDEEWDD